jgi:hypothetical protein
MSKQRLLSILLPIALILPILPGFAQTLDNVGEVQDTRQDLRRQYIEAHEAGDTAGKRQTLQRMQGLQYAPPPERPASTASNSPEGSSGNTDGSQVLTPPNGSNQNAPALGTQVNNPGSGNQSGLQTPNNTNPASPGSGTGPQPDKPKGFLDGLKIGGGTNSERTSRHFASNEDGTNKFERSGSRVYRRGEKPENKGPKPPSGPTRWQDRTEVGIDRQLHKKDRELKKYETETAKEYKDRKDLAKGRAGVRFGTLDTNASVGAKWNVGTGEVSAGGSAGATVTAVSGAAEGRIGNDNAAVGGKASGTLLKAEAKINGRIGNSKDFAGAKVEAGIGGSVAEGTLSGTVGSNWLGINVTGEVSGSVLTAEAKGVASAGYNKKTGKFEVEIGGKIGALLAGGGARIKIALNKPGWWPW